MADDRVGERAHAGVVMTGSDGFDGPKAFYILIEALPLCGKPTNLGAADASDIDHAVPGLVLRSSWRRSTLSNPPRVYWRCDRSGLCVSLSARPPKHEASTRPPPSFGGYRAAADRKRDGGTEDVVGVVKLLDPGQSFDIGTKAFRCPVGVV